MIDWKITFDIVFVGVSAALILFLFASVIAVVAKGKRRCNAFDIILRIVASLVLIASTALLFCAVLTMLSGSFKIVIADGAWLVVGSDSFALPIARLFVILASSLGAVISFGLFILSLIALIADCKLANIKGGKKADGKQKKTKTEKSAEELKREAQLAKIKRIADAAVQKTSTAADRASEEPAVSESAESEDFDWRVESEKTEKHSEFVGLSDTTDDGFDSFDDIDAQASDAEKSEQYSERTLDEDMQASDDGTDGICEESTERADDRASESDVEFAYGGERSVEETSSVYETEEYASEKTDGVETYERSAEKDEPFGGYDGDAAFSVDAENVGAEDYADGNVEPDRGIYIPKVRTIVKPSERDGAAQKPSAETSGRGTKPPVKSAAKPSGGKAKSGKPKNSGTGKNGGSPGENKRLPVNRRYVIIDRHSAVNMFGKYLKERDVENKDKLESSINTIIIK